MNKTILTILFLCNIILAFSQLDSYYLNDWWYKGNPKKVTISTFIIQKDSTTNYKEIKSPYGDIQIDYYNKINKCVKHQCISLEGSLISECQFKYDAERNRIEHIYLNENLALITRCIVKYSENNLEIKESSFDSSNTLTSEYYYIRDKHSTYLAELYKDTIGIINKRQNIGKENISFNRTYRIIDTNEHINSSIYFYYNKSKQLISYYISNQYNNTSQTIVKHDSLGREIEFIHKNNNYERYKELTIYHDSLNQYQISIYEYGNLKSHTIYKKNKKKLIYKTIKTVYDNPTIGIYSLENKTEQTIHIYETDFLYDINNNWIIKTEYQNGNKSRIIKRKFEY